MFSSSFLLELGTMAYVACGVLIYTFWWFKPNDMTTQIIVPLRYERGETPPNVKEIMEEYPMGWQHLRAGTSPNPEKSPTQVSEWYYRSYFFDVGSHTRLEHKVPLRPMSSTRGRYLRLCRQ